MSHDLVLVVAALLGWGVVTAAAHVLTRFGRPAPGPASPEPPDDLPPGVVAFLVGGPGTEAAAAATLVDLAGRGVLVVDAPAGGPATVRPGRPVDGLDRLESLVLARVRSLGRGGPVPLPALAARAGAPEEDDVREAVVEATRARRLTCARAGWVLRCVLVAAALVPALAVGALAVARAEDTTEPGNILFAVAAVTLVVLLGPVWGRFDGERLTRSGRRAASAWLGHGTHLGRDELLRAAAPADVAVQGRRLAHARALGLTRGLDRLVRFGRGDRGVVWSSFGGTWRQVEVRYPRGFLAGRSAGGTTLYGLWLVGVVAACTFTLFWVPAAAGWSPDGALLPALRLAGVVVLLAVGVRVLLRIAATVLEIGAEREVVGEVLWLEEHHVGRGEDSAWVETYHLAVDDGSSDRTTAWSLPADLRDRCHSGDHIRMTVRPWSRTVRAVERIPVAAA
ncbi:DUF2207 domain-containing protein [Kineosporia sp. R_H_3]|uniref:DUF2207 domain-containing protein n=1 Tax=Kineosporia sp. R_H_3 TaxID=1961848 RepID=UPI000B4BA99D|nr:DUF2207 domain-containing protein [Kineosporia sp. R_H_3]